jgi:hypothetical protein
VPHKENGCDGKVTCSLFLCLRKEYPNTVIIPLSFNFTNCNAKKGKILALGNGRLQISVCVLLKIRKRTIAQQLPSNSSNVLNTTESNDGFSCACALIYGNWGNSTAGASHPTLPCTTFRTEVNNA